MLLFCIGFVSGVVLTFIGAMNTIGRENYLLNKERKTMNNKIMEYLYDNNIDFSAECPDDENIKDKCAVETNLQQQPQREPCMKCWKQFLERMEEVNNE